jgi:multidrug resistance efflux pump
MGNQKKIKEEDNVRNEEVADIIDRMPSGFGYWVGGIVIVLAVLLFFFGYFIKYPDVLKGQITINAMHAPVRLVSNITGTLDMLEKRNGDKVEEGEYLAIVKNAAELKDIILLDTLLGKINLLNVDYTRYRKYFPEDLKLGEVSNAYFFFLKSLYEYLDYFNDKPYEKQRDINKKLLVTQGKFLSENRDQLARLGDKVALTRSLNRRDSILAKSKAIAVSDLEKSSINKISNEQEYGLVVKEIINNIYQIDEAKNKLQVLDIQQHDKERELKIALFNSFSQIQESIKEWKRKYTFQAPFRGRVDFMNFLRDDDFVQQGQELFTVVPEENEVIGQVFIPEQGSGKIKVGQEVIIKLDLYPYAQYGSVKGVLQRISFVPNSQVMSGSQGKVQAYLLTVSLPQGLVTNYGTRLEFKFEAKGIAEIITEDRRLIGRLFDNLKYKTK